MKSTKLKVAEGLSQDVGAGRARLDGKTRVELDIAPGDRLKIEGERKTATIVWRARPIDEGKGIIGIDKLTRENAGVSIGNVVTVSKIKPKKAHKVEFQPASEQLIEFNVEITYYMKRGLLKRPVIEGDKIVVPGIALFGKSLPFYVTKTNPKGIVEITEDTIIEVSDTPFMLEQKKEFQKLYNDITGENSRLNLLGIETTIINQLLKESKSQTKIENYEMALKLLGDAKLEIEKIRKTIKPSLAIIFYPEQLYVDEWHRIELSILNNGKIDCKDIIVKIEGDIEIKGWSKIPYLRVGERENLLFSIRPKKSGSLSIKIECQCSKPYESGRITFTHKESVSVGDRIPQRYTIEYQSLVCPVIGQFCTEKVTILENEYVVAHAYTKDKFDDLRKAIEEALNEYDMKPYYADKEVRKGHILCKICKKIQSAKFGIYEISQNEKGEINPNVSLELGLAYGLKKPCLLIVKKGSKVITDLKGLDRIEYESNSHLTSELSKKIVKFLE